MGWTVDDMFLVGHGPEQVKISRTEVVNLAVGPFTDGLPKGWEPQPGLGEWSVSPNGTISGFAGPDRAAILWCTDPVEGDHMIEFDACTVAPAANDLNCYWEGSGKYDDKDPSQFCTIAGIGGWWKGYTGIERSLNNIEAPTGRSITGWGHLVPGQILKVAGGRMGNVDFLFINGELRMQIDDPSQRRRDRSKVAIATWDSRIEISCARVSRIAPA